MSRLVRLETLFRYWEDLWWGCAELSRAGGDALLPVERNAPAFRSYLASHHGGVIDPRFLPPQTVPGLTGHALILPYFFAAWFSAGRPSYRLDAALQERWAGASPPDMPWRELDFPSRAFAIELATPLMLGKDRFEVLLVADIAEECDWPRPLWSFLFVPDKFDRYVPISLALKDGCASLRRGNPMLYLTLLPALQRIDDMDFFSFALGEAFYAAGRTADPHPRKEGIQAEIERSDQQILQLCTQSEFDALHAVFVRILVGMALHCAAAPPAEGAVLLAPGTIVDGVIVQSLAAPPR